MDEILPQLGSEVGDSSAESSTVDEEAARQTRAHFRESGVSTVQADPDVTFRLAEGEQVVGLRRDAVLASVERATEGTLRDVGRLYVTDRRLLHLGTNVTSIPLQDLHELTMAEERILVTLAGSRGIVLEVRDPRQFRVLIAAAKTAARGSA